MPAAKDTPCLRITFACALRQACQRTPTLAGSQVSDEWSTAVSGLAVNASCSCWAEASCSLPACLAQRSTSVSRQTRLHPTATLYSCCAPLSLDSLSREREVEELWHGVRSSALSATPPHVCIAPLSCCPALLRCFMLLKYTLVALPEASIEVEVPVPTPPTTAFNLEPTTRVPLACAL